MLLHIKGFTSVISQQQNICAEHVVTRNVLKLYFFLCFLVPNCANTESQMTQTLITHHVKHLSILPGGEDHLRLQARLEEEALSRHCAASTRRKEGAEQM